MGRLEFEMLRYRAHVIGLHPRTRYADKFENLAGSYVVGNVP